MERLDCKDGIVKLIKDYYNNPKLHLFDIKNNEGHSVLRAVTICKNCVAINDFVYNDNHKDVDDDLEPAIEKYELSVPLDLYKSCAIQDKTFVLQYNIINKMNELDSLLSSRYKLRKWFIKSIDLDIIKDKITILEGDECA